MQYRLKSYAHGNMLKGMDSHKRATVVDNIRRRPNKIDRRHGKAMIEAEVEGDSCKVYESIVRDRQTDSDRQAVIDAVDQINELNRQHSRRVWEFLNSLPDNISSMVRDEMYCWDY